MEQGIDHFCVGVGSTKDLHVRCALFQFGLGHGCTPLQVCHPSSVVSPFAEIDVGTQILARAVINAGAKIGQNSIINTGAIVEHDCVIGNHVHLAPGCTLSGTVRVDDRAHIGAGATIRQGIHIGEDALVGAGAVVVKDVAPRTTVIGVPARVLLRPCVLISNEAS